MAAGSGDVGRGLATEGGRAAIDHAFDHLGIDRVISVYEPPNEKSGAVMERLGMRHWQDFADPIDGRPLRVYEVTR